MKNSENSFHHVRAIILVAIIGLIRLNILAGQTISVYSSSIDGDRLTRKPDNMFTSPRESSLPVITVNDGKKFQRIDGFGATFNEAGMICLNSLSGESRNKVFKMLFDPESGAGYTVMKSPIAACDFASAGPWYSYNDVPGDTAMIHFTVARDEGPNGLIPFIKKASEFGRFEIETTMDFAPDWMYVSLKKGEKHLKPEYYRALAMYYSKYIQAYSARGITLSYLNPFNEPENEWYSNVTYKAIGEMIKNYIIPRFRLDGINTRIQLSESCNRPEALQKFPVVLDDPVTRNFISTLTVHGYDWDKFSTLTDLHTKYPDIPIWQTEVCYARVANTASNEPPGGPDHLPVYDFTDGEFWGNMIMNDMKNHVSAWVYWNMILDQEGGPWLVSTEHGDPDLNQQQPVVIINRKSGEVTYTGLYYYLAHFSKFIRPGAYRIDCTGGSVQLNFTGFRNSDGSITLNIINNGNATDCRISWKNQMVTQKLKGHSITTLKWSGLSDKTGLPAGQMSGPGMANARIGVSQINITPTVPVLMSGYDARKTPNTGIHDSLYASAIYLSEGENSLMLITTDLIGFSGSMADDIRKGISLKTGIASGKIMLTAAHNHGGPALRTYENKLPAANDDYIKILKERLISLSFAATQNPVPFRMGIGKGICRMNINRRAEFADGGIGLGRNPEGPCDHELDVVKFEDLNQRTLAVLVNWSCHGTASGQDNYQITADWPGAAARYIKKQEGREVIVGIIAGASGDINPIYGPGNDFNEIEAVGYQAGKEAWKILGEITTIPLRSIQTTSTTITLPGKKSGKDQFPQAVYESAPDVEIRLTVFKIGELVLCGISGEVMNEIGAEIKSESPYTNTVIVTHCNGSSGYICTDKAFGEGGYEVKVTRLMPGAETPVIENMLALIHSL